MLIEVSIFRDFCYFYIMERKCYNCRNYCALVNQGYWWCDKQLDMNHPETCGGWDEVPQASIDWSLSCTSADDYTFKVAIVGSRTFTDYDLAEKFIDKVCDDDAILISKIISGGQKVQILLVRNTPRSIILRHRFSNRIGKSMENLLDIEEMKTS